MHAIIQYVHGKMLFLVDVLSMIQNNVSLLLHVALMKLIKFINLYISKL
jgi:hypothetical protein